MGIECIEVCVYLISDVELYCGTLLSVKKILCKKPIFCLGEKCLHWEHKKQTEGSYSFTSVKKIII